VAELGRLTKVEFPSDGNGDSMTTAVGGEGTNSGSTMGESASSESGSVLPDAAAQLEAYFAGELTDFNLALGPRGTDFQLATWEALLEIPFGETISYADLAHRIGKPAAVRAVGAANGANPLPIVIPCHRVIGSNGRLVGYGGGLEIKRFLLALEQGTLF